MGGDLRDMGLSGRRKKLGPSSPKADNADAAVGFGGPGWSTGSRPSALEQWDGIGKQSVRRAAKQSGVQCKACVPAGKGWVGDLSCWSVRRTGLTWQGEGGV